MGDLKSSGILAFCRRFPDEQACLETIFTNKFADHLPCPRCGQTGAWGKVRGTKKYFHACRHQISPLNGTAFYRSNLSLTACFYAILLFANCSSGVRSSFLRRQLGLGPKSSHRLSNRVRLHMAAYARPETLGGPGKRVEVDEVLLRHIRIADREQLQKAIVMGLTCEGKVITGIIPDRKRATLHAHIVKHVKPGSTVITDDWIGYRGIGQLGYRHIPVNHSKGYFNEAGNSTCAIDSYWASLRRMMRRYHQVAPENLWLFLAEAECRYNFRHRRELMFDELISHWPALTQEHLGRLERRFDWRLVHSPSDAAQE